MSSENSTEKSILDGVLGEEEDVTTGVESGDDPTTTADGQTQNPGSADTSGATQDGTRRGQRDPGAGPRPDPNKGTQPGSAGKQPAQAATKPPQGANPGDLVDPQTGEILARAGGERRVYERAERRVRNAVKAQLDSLNAQVETFKQSTNYDRYGISPQEASVGLQLISAWKKNPVETLKYLLTEAKAMGHNIDDLGGGGAIDAAAIKRMVDQAVEPLVNDRKASQAEQEARNKVDTEFRAFATKYPDYKPHEADIAKLLRENDDISPEVAYLQLQAFALRNSLDWSKPLGPQILARSGGAQPSGQQRQGLPVGRNVSGAAPVGTARTVAHESTPTRSIVMEAMREAGYKI